ncbi:MAG: preprotein translocase subunit SecG [Aquabacterium sp.]|uniref:preprotein translocase subunit SecG n=1 Tax=Aquabacterium sp. TaxID=1872578 RepID=UPI0025C1B6A0|nr:preprotein translocase subunit SecG [Aquabacterium sp.]MBI3380681.1 preprotein translocase subunit SecG [Aquabacterium sp.]
MQQALMTVVLLLQVVSALTMIGLVLVQHGKGADMGASFGSGASGSLFGATGSANFLSRSTAVAAAVFFSSTLALAYFGNHRASSADQASVLDQAASAAVSASAASAVSAPAAPASGAALIPNK